ncbi:hydroxymethylglutaryl-CoA lyase [Conexibacter woesei]|uniref:Pyruvate carboxyltransferase n=1 Tax=Conexibacter woesei (strain DSM 14684 / CCUG 47730 / CIP 108061 / JCM 11494 / NBRC 100937 / ID131577) TaxID=469383 RepID=D3F3M8_CONWI|nr:hydroxymethylglutaryl-CoA lyase [Conexibacter woesei]ADB52393.1 pyruvate carboxyltransferase [Conexibacter woesei DSM 14684]
MKPTSNDFQQPAGVEICEVGPRDGLQNHPTLLGVRDRIELVERLSRTGVPRLETTSFVNERRVPAMAGADEVAKGLARSPGLRRAALVLNERGYERLAAADLDEVHVAFAASEELNRRNQNASPAQSCAAALAIVERAHADGRSASVTIAAAFGCPFEGVVDPGVVLDYAARVIDGGADEVVFADTIGVGVPAQVRRLVAGGRACGGRVGVHLHNTRNTGYANAYAALEAGAQLLDASIGGLGGCPFSPGATGNIATEDLVYLLHGEGVSTGIDLDALIEVSIWLEGVLGTDLPGQLHRAGGFPPPVMTTASRGSKR